MLIANISGGYFENHDYAKNRWNQEEHEEEK